MFARKRRHRRVRKHISGTALRPRMNIFRSNSNIFVQVIDDIAGRTLVSCSTIDKDVAAELVDKKKVEAAKIVGLTIAARAKEVGINTVVFDRGDTGILVAWQPWRKARAKPACNFRRGGQIWLTIEDEIRAGIKKERDEFDERVVDIRRVAKVIKGGPASPFSTVLWSAIARAMSASA